MKTRLLALCLFLAGTFPLAARAELPTEVGFDGGFTFVQVKGGDSSLFFGVPSSVIGGGMPQVRATMYVSPKVGLEATAGLRFTDDAVDAQLGLCGLLFTAGDWASTSPYVRAGIHFTDPGAGPRLGLGMRIPVLERVAVRPEGGFLWSIQSGPDVFAWSATLGISFLVS